MISSSSIRRSGRRLKHRSRRLARRLAQGAGLRRAAAAVLILSVAFAAGTWAVLPYLAVRAIESWADASASRSARAEHVRVNPFTLTFTLDGVVIEDEGTSLAAERAVLDFDAAALLGRPALDAIWIERAALLVETPRQALRALDDALARSERLRIERLEITDAHIEWPSRRGETDVVAGIRLVAHGLEGGTARSAPFVLDIADAAGGAVRAEGEIVPGRREGFALIAAEHVDVDRIVVGASEIEGVVGGSLRVEWDGAARAIGLRDVALRIDGARLPAARGIEASVLEASGEAELRPNRVAAAGRVSLEQASLGNAPDDEPLEAERIDAPRVRVALSRAEAVDGAETSPRGAAAAWAGSLWLDELALIGPRAVVRIRGRHDAPSSGAGGPPVGSPAPAAGRGLGGGAPGIAAAAASLLTAPDAAAVSLPTSDPAAGPARTLREIVAGAGRISLRGGTVRVVDERISPAVAFDLIGVGGSLDRADDGGAITGDIDVRFAAGGSGSLSLHAVFDGMPERTVGIELQQVPADAFGAYTERLAGVAFGRGAVDARVEYRVAGDALDGSADVQAQGIELEDGDENLRLGLALLEDEHGTATASVPFEAHAGPGVPRAIAETLRAHLGSVAARPFDALAAASGAADSRLDAVGFAPGNAEPAPQGIETLDRLADALRARPKVGIRVHGVAERPADRDALAAAQVELHVTLATAGPVAVARPQPVDFDSPRHRDVLDEFAGERLGAERAETIASYFTRDESGRVVEAERAAYYRALFDALVENETIPDNGLERLARYRAMSVADALAALGVAAERIEVAAAVVRDARMPDPPDSSVAAQIEPANRGASSTDGARDAAHVGGADLVEARLDVFLPDSVARADGRAAEPLGARSDSAAVGPAQPVGDSTDGGPGRVAR